MTISILDFGFWILDFGLTKPNYSSSQVREVQSEKPNPQPLPTSP
jgi:hypothetical protein